MEITVSECEECVSGEIGAVDMAGLDPGRGVNDTGRVGAEQNHPSQPKHQDTAKNDYQHAEAAHNRKKPSSLAVMDTFSPMPKCPANPSADRPGTMRHHGRPEGVDKRDRKESGAEGNE